MVLLWCFLQNWSFLIKLSLICRSFWTKKILALSRNKLPLSVGETDFSRETQGSKTGSFPDSKDRESAENTRGGRFCPGVSGRNGTFSAISLRLRHLSFRKSKRGSGSRCTVLYVQLLEQVRVSEFPINKMTCLRYFTTCLHTQTKRMDSTRCSAPH